MRRLVFPITLFILSAGCGSSVSNNGGTNVPVKLDPDKEYATLVLAAIDRFTLIVKTAEYVDNETAQAYLKSGKASKDMLARLRKGVDDGGTVVKLLYDMHPPTKFQAFHDQVVRSTEAKEGHMAGLLLAMEQNNKVQIAKVLDDIEKEGAESKAEMDKILGGKTAEAYLGLTTP